jgi:hypothetical protein
VLGEAFEGGGCLYVLASVSGGDEAKLGGLPPERGRGTMAASWQGGIVASMAGGRDSGGGKAVAVVLPIVRPSWFRCC